jgi:hypothetical protein
MATASSIAIRRNAAQERLLAAAAELGVVLGVAVPEWPVHKQPEIARAMELETAAGVLEAVAIALKKIPPAAPAAVSGSSADLGVKPAKGKR